MLERWPQSIPLGLPGKAALAQDNKTRVKFNVQQFDKVSSVRRDNCQVIFKGIRPKRRIGGAAQTDMRNRLGINAKVRRLSRDLR